jgi:small subunit ribosomal protein S6
MQNYEVLYILSPDITDEERQAVIDKFKKFVEDRSGVVGAIDKWGLKTLAYPIKFKKEGHYVLMNYQSSEQASIEMGKLMLITENILRHIIIKK